MPQLEPRGGPDFETAHRVGTDRDRAASCGSKTLQWTTGMRK